MPPSRLFGRAATPKRRSFMPASRSMAPPRTGPRRPFAWFASRHTACGPSGDWSGAPPDLRRGFLARRDLRDLRDPLVLPERLVRLALPAQAARPAPTGRLALRGFQDLKDPPGRPGRSDCPGPKAKPECRDQRERRVKLGLKVPPAQAAPPAHSGQWARKAPRVQLGQGGRRGPRVSRAALDRKGRRVRPVPKGRLGPKAKRVPKANRVPKAKPVQKARRAPGVSAR